MTTAIRSNLNLSRELSQVDRSLRPALARRLRTYFRRQSARAVHALLEATPASSWGVPVKVEQEQDDPPAGVLPNPEELVPNDERQMLFLALIPFLFQATLRSGNIVARRLRLDMLTDADPRVVAALRGAGTRISGIHGTTLDAVRTALHDGAQRGYSIRQIAFGVPDEGFRGLHEVVDETYAGRAMTIARTEIANARQEIVLDRYHEARVAMVLVRDGSGCGWASHADSDKANGTRRTLIEARSHPTAHPNCVRQFLPAR